MYLSLTQVYTHYCAEPPLEASPSTYRISREEQQHQQHGHTPANALSNLPALSYPRKTAPILRQPPLIGKSLRVVVLSGSPSTILMDHTGYLHHHTPLSGVPHPPPPPGPGQKTVRRRNRVINSCLECRRRKLKCSRDYPCAACTKHGRKCVFLDTALDSIGLHKLTEIKNRVGSLEDLLETEVAGRSQRHSSEDSSVLENRGRSNTDSPPVRTRIKIEDLSGPSTLAASPYENELDEEYTDLGVRIGLLRLNEKIGGLLRPSITKEVRPYITHSTQRHFWPNPQQWGRRRGGWRIPGKQGRAEETFFSGQIFGIFIPRRPRSPAIHSSAEGRRSCGYSDHSAFDLLRNSTF